MKLLAVGVTQCSVHPATPPESVDVLPRGTILGNYTIERPLGAGGMGAVYAAINNVERREAIKFLHSDLAREQQNRRRFLDEGRAVNRIKHRNLVEIFNLFETDGHLYIAMELLDGKALEDMMGERRPLPLPLLLHLFEQIAEALSAAHRMKIVHRDLKPPNVFVIANDASPYFVKLLDFGIARLHDEGIAAGTVMGTIMGTPEYMSPEQIIGGKVEAASDIWALGVMLYLAASGVQLFTATQRHSTQEDLLDDLRQQILHKPIPPAHRVARVPRELSSLIASCLARDVAARCASAEAVVAQLQATKQASGLDNATIHAMLVAARRGEPDPWSRRAPPKPAAQPAQTRRRGVGLWLAGACVLVAAGYAGRTAFSARPDSPGAVPGARSTAPAAIAGQPKSIAEPSPAARARWRDLAEQDLRAAIGSEQLQQRGLAVDAIARAHTAAAAPLLTLALAGPLEVRLKAARGLGELALPDAAPKLRAALADTGDKPRLEIAAWLYRLGDKDARAMLVRAAAGGDGSQADPAARLTAALALAEAHDGAGRDALAEALASFSPGSPAWRRAAGGLLALGAADARRLLQAELSQPDAMRAVGAAELLARAGVAAAREQLARSAADPQFARPGDAAAALARLGDARALDWAAGGLASNDAGERGLALGICGRLAADPAQRARVTAMTAAIARLASGDPDLGVRMTAEAVVLGL